jgi:hypothetical protein
MFLAFVLGLVAGCASSAAPLPFAPLPTPTARSTITDYASLVAAFKAQSIPAAAGEEISDPLFAVKKRMLNLPRARVAVIEYSTEAEAQAQATKISPSGNEIGNTIVDWVDMPHFYRVNRLVLLYIGRDDATLDLLARVLGPQFAGALRGLSTPTIVYAPTAMPAPTEAPAATEVVDPRTPTVMPWDLAQATIAARATAHPFPTPDTVMIQRGAPSSATARRDGLSFRLELPTDTYLGGEGGNARLTLRNDGRETLFVGIGHDLAQVFLMDEQGHEAPPFPWFSPSFPGMPYVAPLASGAVVTSTVQFHVPPLEPGANHSYALWAWTNVSRRAPENGNWADNLWLHLETGPIALHISAPSSSQRLIAKLDADRQGWRVKVRDVGGATLKVPLWGALEASTYSGFSSRSLHENAQGAWSGTWNEDWQSNQISLRVWVSAPGYVTALANVEVPGTRAGRTMFDTLLPPRQAFSSLDAAQAAVNLPLYKPETPPGAALDRVQVEDSTYDNQRRTFIRQVYRLAGNHWFELTQMNWTEHFENAGWGSARYDPEAQRVSVAGATGYLIRQFDWWILDWKIGDVGFELHAPVAALPREQLVSIAASVQP